MYKFILLLIIFNNSLLSKNSSISQKKDQENNSNEKEQSTTSANEPNTWKDIKSAFSYFRKSSYKQFYYPSSWYTLGLGSAATYAIIRYDEELLHIESMKPVSDFQKKISDSTLYFSFPVIPVAGYISGRIFENEKLRRFSQEYFATLYLALIESGLISIIPIHERPNKENLSYSEKKFRFVSSFPSGHIIPFATLSFKTFQYYGLWPSLIPAFFTGVVAKERLRSRKHYVSDIFGSIILSFLASQGSQAASEYENNHPLYQWIFDHQFDLKFYSENGNWNMLMSIDF